MGPFSPVEMAHWEKSCETWQRDVRTFSLDVLRGPSNWYMVVSLFCPKSSQYAFCCLSPSDWEKGKNWKRLPFSGVLHKTTFSSALSALNNRFLEWGFQYRTFSILSPSKRANLHCKSEKSPFSDPHKMDKMNKGDFISYFPHQYGSKLSHRSAKSIYIFFYLTPLYETTVEGQAEWAYKTETKILDGVLCPNLYKIRAANHNTSIYWSERWF